MKSILISLLVPFRLSKNGLELWMQTRREDGPLNGFLEFPGGKIEAGESFREAAIREFEEETGANVGKVDSFKNYSHEYPDRSVKLFVFLSQMPQACELDEDGWRRIDFDGPLRGLEDKILSANHLLVSDLSRYFQEIWEDGSWSELWPPL